ncbi:MAG TPA: hypothetical protein VL360_01150 [Gammaproteobacteria bacterium]|nr:hypothetical protein [Gammaproteobacteria bacterium]
MGKKLYAVIQPPAYIYGNLLDVEYPLLTLYHRFMYPTICGYSLANQIFFYDTLEEAKEHVFPSCGIRGKDVELYKHNSQNAVIKLGVENNKVVNLDKLCEIKEFKDGMFRDEKVKQAVWKETLFDDIIDETILNAINEQLQLRYYHPHYADSKDPRAKLCRQLSTEYINKSGLNAEQLQHEFFALSAITASWAVSTVISLMKPNFPVQVSLILGAGSLAAASGAYYFHSALEDNRKSKIAYIKNGLFAANQSHQPYNGPMTRSRKKAEEQLALEPPRLSHYQF